MSPTVATASGFLTILIWGATVAWVRLVSEEVGPVSAGAWMCIGAAVTVWIWRLIRQPWGPPRVSAMSAAANGGLFALYLVCFSVAVGTAATPTESLTVGLVNYLWPSIALILGPLLVSRRPGVRVYVQAAVAVAGTAVAVLARGDVSLAQTVDAIAGRPLPYVMALCAAFCWATYTNTAGRWHRPTDENAVIVYLPMAAAATGAVAWWFEGLPLPTTTGGAVSLVLLCVATAIGYIGWDEAMRNGHRRVLATASLFTPILSICAGAISFGTLPGWNVWAGATILVGAAWMGRTEPPTA
jgi:drug/metabolite transporter (DMT)-like permease